ncbi:MAG: hypothetical protein K0U08_03280 [Proteobacteria bacterium]|nr:hypothetical protein [Pseudomonadota bacterium]
MNVDTKIRPLTVEDSKTNKAWNIFQSMTPIEKFEMSRKFETVSDINKRQAAIVNFIEGSL